METPHPHSSNTSQKGKAGIQRQKQLSLFADIESPEFAQQVGTLLSQASTSVPRCLKVTLDAEGPEQWWVLLSGPQQRMSCVESCVKSSVGLGLGGWGQSLLNPNSDAAAETTRLVKSC